MSGPSLAAPLRLAEALRQYLQAPGRYAVRLGQPPELHEQWDTVAQWALGRIPDALRDDADVLHRAAVLFLKRTCLAEDSTPHEVLALGPGACAPERVRARYRMLIRLTHPDVGIPGLHADAVQRVILAYETLVAQPGVCQAGGKAPCRQGGAGKADRQEPLPVQAARVSRWDMTKARHPRLVVHATTAALVLVLVAGMTVWVLVDAADSRMLVAPRVPAQSSATPPEPQRTTEPGRASGDAGWPGWALKAAE